MTYTIGLIVGSVSQPSLNRRLATALVALAPRVDLVLQDIEIAQLPFFGTHLDGDGFPPEGQAFKAAVDATDGLLFVTPEYNRSIPGVLKNAVDWATRPAGHSSLRDTPVAVIGTSRGAISTAVAQAQLKSILSSQGAAVLGWPEAYIRYSGELVTDDGQVTNEGTEEFLVTFLRAFHDLVARSV